MEYARYKVIGRRQYRGHDPGETFEARLDAAIERAVYRRDIEILGRFNPDLPRDSYTLPDDWPPQANTRPPEAPTGASSSSKEGS